MECGELVVETGFPEFTTFSVGEGEDRRTVVCFQQQLLEYTLGNHKWEKARDTGDYREMAETEAEDEDSAKKSDLVSENDKCSHVINGCEDRKDTDLLSAKDNSSKNFNASDNTTTAINDTTEHNADIFNDCENDPSPMFPKQVLETSAEPSPVGTPSKKSSRRSKRPERAVYVPPRGRGKPLSPNAMEFKPNNAQHIMAEEAPESPASVTDEVPVRDVTNQVVNEITTGVGGVQIETPSVDYSSFQTSDSTINIDQFGHVIEVYDFPQQMKTSDLMAAYHAFTARWDIKWVDDTHALGVFSSAEVAAEALAMRHPNIKSRPLNMATAQSKCKARAVCEYLLPYKPRPATSTAPARRLLQWALGSDKKVPAASQVEQDRLRDAIKRKEEDRRRRREELVLEKQRNNYAEHDDR
eukprot:GFUD01073678.1.p1 GENE.GFUD01073678.1~~GFUD01073678.1.p1  ORF type:complete len:413 (-),score=112.11 GFUD01073678.1:172-1410(-)